MMNIWKVSTLALAGALAIVVGQGSVRESSACEGHMPTAEEITQTRLIAAFRFLDRAEREIKAAPAAPRKPRAAALRQIAMAKMQVQKGLLPEEEEEQMQMHHRPPRPMLKKLPSSDKTASVSFR